MKKKLLMLFTAIIILCSCNYNENVVRIAAILPLTGEAAQSGEVNKNTISMLVETWNKAGGINGKEIVIDFYDSKGESKNGSILASQIVSMQKPIFVFTSFSGISLSAQPIFERNKVIQICGAATDKLFEINPKYTIRSYFSSSNMSDYFINNFEAYFDKKKFVLFYENTDYGLSYKNEFSNSQVVSNYIELNEKENNYRNIISKAQLKGDELIFLAARLQTIGRIVKQLRESGFNGNIIGDAAMVGDEPLNIIGNQKDNLYYLSLSENENTGKIKDEYFEKFNSNIDIISLVIYDGLNSLLNLMDENGGNTDPDFIIKNANGIISNKCLNNTTVRNNEFHFPVHIKSIDNE